MVDQLLETVAHEAVRNRLLSSRLAKLQHEALAQVARANARRVEILDDDEHLLDFGERVERKAFDVALGLLRRALDFLVHAAKNLLEGTGEVAVLVDIADEFIGEKLLSRREIK